MYGSIEYDYYVSIQITLEKQRQEFKDVSVLGILADNHDMPRFLNLSSDVTLLKNALVYVLIGEVSKSTLLNIFNDIQNKS